MSCASTMSMESHRSAATLYLTDELTTATVLEAIECVAHLPEDVRALRVDLRGVRRCEAHALRTLQLALRNWRAVRRGMTRVTLAAAMVTDLVAIKFAHQRWSPAVRRPIQPTRDARAGRFRDHRQALVTRSLRERAGSETR